MSKSVDVKIEDVLIPPTRITAVYDEELTEQLSSTMDTVGQLVPILVIDVDGVYHLVDGLHRLQEAKRQGAKNIKAVVKKGTEADALLLNLVTNSTRGKTKASEMVVVLGELYATCGLSIEEIRQRTGFSQRYIETLLAISEASPMVREALDKELIGVGLAFEIQRLPRWIQQDELVSRAETFHITVPAMKTIINNILQAMKDAEEHPLIPGPPPPPVIYTCNICREEIAKSDLGMVAICPVCHSAAWKAAQDKKDSVRAAEIITSHSQ